MANTEFKTSFGIDDKITAPLNRIIKLFDDFNQSIYDAEHGLSDLDKENLDNLDKNLDEVADNLEDVVKNTGTVKKEIKNVPSNAFDSLNRELNEFNRSLTGLSGETSEVRSNLNRLDSSSLGGIKVEASKAESGLKGLEQEAHKAKESLDEIGDTNLQDSLGSLSDAINLNNFLNLTEVAEKAVSTLTDLGESAMESSLQVTDAFNSIKMGLSVTEEGANNLYNVAREVFRNGFGESIGDVTDRLVYMKQLFGDMSDADLQTLLPQFISLDQAGMDFNETLRGVRNLTTAFGVDAQTATDFMAEGLRRGLNFSDELGDNIAEYAARWGEARVSLGSYFSLLEAGTQNGAYNLDKVGDFLNEFMTSLTDGRMDEAMGSLSENSREVFASYQSGGANAQDVLNSVLTDFQNITSETDRAALASTLWSSLGEDNAMGMIQSLNGVPDSYSNIAGAAQDMADNSSNAVTTLQNRWNDWKDGVLAPIGEFLANTALGVMDFFGRTQEALGNLANSASSRWNDIIGGFQNFESTLRTELDNWTHEMLSVGSNIIDGLKQGLDNGWTSVKTWFSDSFGGIVQSVKDMLGIASPSTVFSGIGGFVVEGFKKGLENTWSTITSWASGAINGLKNLFSGIWNGLTGGGDSGGIDYSAQIESAKTQLQQLQATVAQGFNSILGQIGSAMTAITTQVVGQLQNLISSLAPQLSSIIPYIQVVYNNFLNQTILTLNAVKQATIIQAQDMVAQMGASIGGLNSVFMQAFTLISTQTLSILVSLNNSSVTILTSLSRTAGSIMETTRSNMVNTVQTMANAVISTYALLSNRSLSIILNMANSLILDYTNLVNSLIKLMNTLCTSVLGIINRFVGNIKSTIGTLPPYFYGTGQLMMNNLRAGIESSRGGVISTTASLVQQLKSTFEAGLGIHSPSDYMIWIGQMLLAGLIQGMSGSQVQKFIESMIGDMRTSFKNGNFNADELVDFLGADSTLNVIKYLDLIGDQTVSDLFGDGGVPAIIQEALKYVGYAPGGGNSMFGLHYGNAGAWCASFVRYCAEQVGVPFPATNYVPDVLDWSIANGRYTQTPQPGYAAIFGGGSHIELVAGVGADGTVDMVGGNTGMGEVKHRPRNDATSYVVLDGGHSTMTLRDTIQRAYNKKFNPAALMVGAGANNYNPNGGAEQWRSTVLQALAMLGQPASLADGVLYAIQNESGGNPNAINNWDSNAAMGDPSRGLLQTIGATFNAYRNPSLSADIYDPLANIYAALNYMIQRYGSVANVINPRMGGWYGYEVGTRYVPADMLAMLHEGEAVIPAGQNPYSDSGGDYLSDIANSFVNNASSIPSPISSSDGNVTVSVGNINTTVHVSGSSAADPNIIAETVSEKIMSDLRTAMEKKGGIRVEY